MGLIDKILYALNLVAAILLMLSFVTPYIPPENFPLLSALSLMVSPLLVINFLFIIYWLIRLKKRVWLSAVLLVVGYFHFNAFWKWGTDNELTSNDQLKLLSFNVQLFEAYKEEPDPEVYTKFKTLIDEHQPDVLLIQEFYRQKSKVFDVFPYQYVHFRGNRKLGHAIFSKYPLLNKGAFDFDSTNNNCIFADVVTKTDTLRVYNIHLQSFKISPSVAALQDGSTKQLGKNIRKGFKLQQQQIASVLEHSTGSGYPVIMGGDLNNTAFSYVYRKIAQQYQDSFHEAGSGLGSTFTFDFYPVRIDYIFAEPPLKVLDFETLKRPFSDHRPIMSTIGWD